MNHRAMITAALSDAVNNLPEVKGMDADDALNYIFAEERLLAYGGPCAQEVYTLAHANMGVSQATAVTKTMVEVMEELLDD